MGMTGADALTPESFRGRRMLNLDSEEDDALYIGCAGGCDTNLTWEFTTEPVAKDAPVAQVTVSGLRGGHSGSDIHENRGNAIKILAETIAAAGMRAPLRIVGLTGGSKRNAIPREAEAMIAGSPDLLSALRNAAADIRDKVAQASSEKDLTIDIDAAQPAEATAALSEVDSRRLLAVLGDLPHGVLGMHPSVEGLVETSNNVATIGSEPIDASRRLRIVLGMLSRSSSNERVQETMDRLATLGRDAGAKVEHANAYPGWAPNLDSPILGTCRRIYRELFGSEPNVAAIHAGLECGIIGERVGGMDTISLGPTLTGAHSPDERIYIDSVPKTWQFLKAILAELARG
jgi:dipeptidase D